MDLRADDHPQPIAELQRLLHLFRLYFGRTAEEELLPLEASLVMELQAMLRDLGHFSGELNGRFDAATRGALRGWAGVQNLEERWVPGARIDPVVLAHMRAESGALVGDS